MSSRQCISMGRRWADEQGGKGCYPIKDGRVMAMAEDCSNPAALIFVKAIRAELERRREILIVHNRQLGRHENTDFVHGVIKLRR